MINRTQIREKLPHGSIGNIATNAGVSINSVSKWFSGDTNSDRIENAVIKQLEETALIQKKKSKRIETLLEQIN